MSYQEYLLRQIRQAGVWVGLTPNCARLGLDEKWAAVCLRRLAHLGLVDIKRDKQRQGHPLIITYRGQS